MKSTRKKFLQQLAAGTAFAALGLGERLSAHVEELRELPPLVGDGDDYWAKVRERFTMPANAYLNTATLGLMPKRVQEEVAKRMEELSLGRYAIDDGPREAVARLVGAPVSAISMTHNTTEGINIVAQGLRLSRGEEVVITDQEHVGNALPWLNRARNSGIRLRVLSPAPTAAETMNRLNDLVNRKTRALALPHITCTTGQVLPLQEIVKLARDKNIYSVIDGAHGPGMLFPNVHELGCDFYAACGHKWLCGPAGTGFLYVKPTMLGDVTPIMVGAHTDTGWELSKESQGISSFVSTAHRFDYGTQNVALHQGLRAAIEFMEEVGPARVATRTLELASYLQVRLMQRAYVEMLTPTEAASRGAVISFRVRGKDLADLEKFSSTNGFRVRLVPEAGLNAMRISTHLFTTFEELDRLLERLDAYMNR